MKKYFQNLFKRLTISYHVWYKPHALNINSPANFFDKNDTFKGKIAHDEFDKIKLGNKLISTINIQKNAISFIEIRGVSFPIFLN